MCEVLNKGCGQVVTNNLLALLRVEFEVFSEFSILFHYNVLFYVFSRTCLTRISVSASLWLPCCSCFGQNLSGFV